jgi:hypothetical protein
MVEENLFYRSAQLLEHDFIFYPLQLYYNIFIWKSQIRFLNESKSSIVIFLVRFKDSMTMLTSLENSIL